MHIELLWLIPAIAFAGFLFFIALYLQRRTEARSKRGDLSREVELFNAGYSQQKLVTAKSADDRLHEMEKMINYVAEAVANQQRPFRGFYKENDPSGSEAGELREKLRSVFREYDIILSENYTLRAKVKQLTKKIQEQESATEKHSTADAVLTSGNDSPRPHMHLYEDTRLINLAAMDSDDLSEFDDSLAR
jgi:hypothetical protein